MYWLATGERDPFALTLAARHQFDHQSREHRAENLESAYPFLDQLRLVYKQAAEHSQPSGALPDFDVSVVREYLPSGFVFEFAEELERQFGIDVVRTADVNGAFALRVADRYVIVLGQSANWFYQNWSLAHELAHLLAGHLDESDWGESNSGDRETMANDFAAELLMPRRLIESVDWKVASLSSVAQLIWSAGISTAALRTRLRALKITPSPEVASLLEKPTQTVLARHLDGIAPFEISERMERASRRRFPLRLLTALRSSIAAGQAPKASLSWALDLRDSEVEVDEPVTDGGIDLNDLAAELGASRSHS